MTHYDTVDRDETSDSEHLINEAIDSQYRYWRLNVFIGIYFGYAVFYITRKSFTYISPALIQDLGLEKTDIGLIGTLFYFTYGTSKFISGILSDRANPRYFMAAGLFLTGIFNILFGLGTSLPVLASIWALNAFFQGWGWPPCSKILTSWYSRNERGFWWGIWNTTHNVGGSIAPLLFGWLVIALDWRYSMVVAGGLAIVTTLFMLRKIRDKPQTMGLPSVGQWRKDQQEIVHEQEGIGLGTRAILIQYVLTNKILWLLAFNYALIYIIRVSISDWGNLYLTESHHYSLIMANSALSASEIGGFLGCLVAGWGSDWWFRGNRTPMNFIFAIGILLSVMSLWLIPETGYIIQLSLFFLIGFFIYGPQMLIGMAAVECSHKNAAGASNGFVSLFAYAGAATAGYPIAKVMESFGWHGYFVALTICSFMVLVLFVPLLMPDKRQLKLFNPPEKDL